MKIPEPLERADLLRIHYFLRLNRRLEERLSALYKQGTITATVFPGRGQEGISVASAWALEARDQVSALTRNLGTMLVRGARPVDIFRQYMGRADSPTGGKERIHYFGDLGRGLVASLSILGGMIPVMAGIALANRIQGRDAVALTYLGEGATSTGDFHEGMNMASVLALPFVLIVENNGYAYSTPASRQAAIRDFSLRARCYGIPGVTIDGNDVFGVYRTTRWALDHARSGRGPVLVEARTMRMQGHSDADTNWYVSPEELRRWRRRDPIARFERRLTRAGLLDRKGRAEVEHSITALLDRDLDQALRSPEPDGKTALDGVYA